MVASVSRDEPWDGGLAPLWWKPTPCFECGRDLPPQGLWSLLPRCLEWRRYSVWTGGHIELMRVNSPKADREGRKDYVELEHRSGGTITYSPVWVVFDRAFPEPGQEVIDV